MADILNSSATHHYSDSQQQHAAANMGMWLFLATEVLFFGGLFLAYTIYYTLYPEAFAEASHHLNIWLSTLNTAVLLCSSLTVALAIHAVQTGHNRRAAQFLGITILLALVFLGFKGFEYYTEYREGLIPWLNFSVEGSNAPQVRLFFILYFVMTGLHAIHMVIGIFVLGLVALMAYRERFSPIDHDPVELTGLYWHFVDMVWVFLFPLLYLI